MKTLLSIAGSLLLLSGAALLGQSTPLSYPVELAVPFGVVPGRLFVVENHLLFVDLEKPESSFLMQRGSFEASESGGVLQVRLRQPVQDRSGQRNDVAFRLADPNSGPQLLAWVKNGAPPAADTADAAAGPSAAVAEGTVYQVKHNHRIGSCNGRLVIEQGRIVFESISDIGHSRRWALRDIKELKRDNPYKFEVDPFDGGNYDFDLQGQGMESPVFAALVDRVTAARIQ